MQYFTQESIQLIQNFDRGKIDLRPKVPVSHALLPQALGPAGLTCESIGNCQLLAK